jgi:hypothetical protein
MFSDFAYLDRAIVELLCLIFALRRIQTTDHFRSLGWKAFARVELKAVATLLLLLSLICMTVYDFMAAFIKYSEGFWVDPVTGLIITRPVGKYSDANRRLFPSVSVLLNLGWTLQCSALFLMMALWNHMSKAELSKKFMSSLEFKAYAIYSIVSLGLYPVLQVVYFISGNVIVSALVPLLLYVFQCIILLVLCQVTNRRFRRLMRQLPPHAKALTRISAYSEMNNYLSVALLLAIIGLGGIVIDALSVDKLTFNKMALDALSKLFNVGFTAIYPIAILILFPAVSVAESMREQNGMSRQNMKSMHPALNVIAKPERVASAALRSPSPLSPSGSDKSQNMLHRDTQGYFHVITSPKQQNSGEA